MVKGSLGLKKGVEGIVGDGEENQQKQILCEETMMKSNTMYANLK